MAIEITTRMRRGILIHWQGKHYTSLNITDEVARDYLAKFPQNKHYFEVLPPAKTEDKTKDVVISTENAPQSQENAEVIVDKPKRRKSRKTAKNA